MLKAIVFEILACNLLKPHTFLHLRSSLFEKEESTRTWATGGFAKVSDKLLGV